MKSEARQQGCEGTSFAWINPWGKVYSLSGGEWHTDWAARNLNKYPRLKDEYYQTDDLIGTFLRDGWIRVSNAFNLMVWDRLTATQDAWDSATEIVTQCVLDGYDPENEIVRIEEKGKGGGIRRMSVADFVSKYSDDPALERKMYEELMTTRVASRWVDQLT